MDAIVGRIKVVKCAGKFQPCPHCGQKGRRKGYLASRFVVDIEPGGGLCTVELRMAEYRATCSCCKTFRSHPPPDAVDVEPWAMYANRIRDLVVRRLIEDNLSVNRLRHSLDRDFRLQLSEASTSAWNGRSARSTWRRIANGHSNGFREHCVSTNCPSAAAPC